MIADRVPSYVDEALSDDFASASGVVLLADPTDAEQQLAETLLDPLGDAVEVRHARLTAPEEQEMFDEAQKRLSWVRDSGRELVLGWAADIDRFTVVVGAAVPLTNSERAKIGTELDDIADEIRVLDGPKEFTEHCASAPTQTGGWTEGGRLIAQCGTNDCTAGFSVRSIANTAQTGILTAAHCNGWDDHTEDWWYIRYADGTTPFSTVRYADRADYDHGDIMFLREWFTSATPYPRVYRYNQLWQDIDSFQWQNPRNMIVIAKGGQTAQTCAGHQWANMVGAVVDNTVTTNTNSIPPAGNFYCAAVDYGSGSGCANQRSPIGGDSGSAVWVSGSTTAVGIHKGGDPRYEIYSKIGYALQDMNLEMLP